MDWVIQNISSNCLLDRRLKWCTVFGVGCWSKTQITNMAKFVGELRVVDGIGDETPRLPIQVGWRPPSMDTLKLNTDASLEEGT